MPAPASAPSPAAANAPEAAPTGDAPKIGFPFDASMEDCIPDVRALARLPANADEDGVHTLRAIIFKKGSAVHVPGEPGTYATTGAHRTQTALELVHFHAATQRKAELLLSFVDYGMVSTSMSGMYVSSLQLPLQKARNIFEETPRFTPITDVVGFSRINHNHQPWCALLKPAIERQGMLAQLNVFTAVDVVFLMRRPLNARLQTLREFAVEDIDQLVQDLGRQDQKAAEKMKARFQSRLEATVQFFQAMDLKKYDRPMSQRVIKLELTDMSGVQWLKTPERKDIEQGKAKLIATSIRRRGELLPPPQPDARKEAQAEEAEEEPDATSEVDDGFAEPGDGDAEAQAAAPESAGPSRAKRARAPPRRLGDAPPPSKVGKGKKGKKGAGADPEVKQVSACMCPHAAHPCLPNCYPCVHVPIARVLGCAGGK